MAVYMYMLQIHVAEISMIFFLFGFGACLQSSAPKQLIFHPTFFQQKQDLFSRDVKGLVILPLFKEICKEKLKGLLC